MKNAWKNLTEMGHTLNPRTSLMTQQKNWLSECIYRNKKTSYGSLYQFHKIKNINDFRNKVPIVNYENLRSWIETTANGEKDILFADSALAFEKTSGSTLETRLIPYSEHSLHDFQKAIIPWLASLTKKYNLYDGYAYWSISPVLRKQQFTPSGIKIGMADGAYLGKANSIITQLSAVPQNLERVSILADWQLITLYWLIRRNNLELISVWSPTFFLMLIETLDNMMENLIAILANGTAIGGLSLAADKPACQRLIQFSQCKDFSLLWPELKLVSCWGDGVSEKFYQQLQHYLPFTAFQKKGLLSTEGVVTIPDCDNDPVLAGNSGFYEFLATDGNLYLADELKENCHYEVIMTTSGGLYRYKTGDCVTCEKHKTSAVTKDRIPVLRFIGRLGLVSDMVGEKLTEAFVAECLKSIPCFAMLIPQIKQKAGYILVLDQQFIDYQEVQQNVEKALWRNLQYAYARKIGQLEKLSIQLVAKPLDKYIHYKSATGTKVGDIKIPALSKDNHWLVQVLELDQEHYEDRINFS